MAAWFGIALIVTAIILATLLILNHPRTLIQNDGPRKYDSVMKHQLVGGSLSLDCGSRI